MADHPTMKQTTGNIPGYRYLRTSHADATHLSVRILAGLEQVGERLGRVLTIISGYRDPAYSASVGGYSNDPHSRGVGADVYVGSTPIGSYPGAFRIIESVGLESGAQPGFYRGASDPEHVQIPGSGVNKSVVDYGGGGVSPTSAAAGAAKSTGLAGVPTPLADAIEKAARKYNVPPDVLAGIWRIETGSTYPNPYVNSQGYGGLFGTTLWNGSIQAQADLAASTLARLLKANGGDLSKALSAYSGGGYTSVPGGTATQQPGTGLSNEQPPRPGSDGGGGGDDSQLISFGGDVLHGAEKGLFMSPLLGYGFGLGGLKKAYGSAVDSVRLIFHFLTAALWLLHPQNWLRMIEGAAGFGMIMYGFAKLGASDPDSPDVSLGDVRDLAAPRSGTRRQAAGRLGRSSARGARRVGSDAARSSYTGRITRSVAKSIPK